MFENNPPAGRDALRALLASCEVKTLRDGNVISLGNPAPLDLLSAPRVIAVSHVRGAGALTSPDILRFARSGIVWVTNSWEAGKRVLDCLYVAGAPA